MYSRERNGMVSLRYVAEKTREQTTTAITDEEEVELAETENNFQFFCVLFFFFNSQRRARTRTRHLRIRGISWNNFYIFTFSSMLLLLLVVVCIIPAAHFHNFHNFMENISARPDWRSTTLWRVWMLWTVRKVALFRLLDSSTVGEREKS